MISILWANTVYCVQLASEGLSRYSNKIESVGLRKCPYYHYLYIEIGSVCPSVCAKVSTNINPLPSDRLRCCDLIYPVSAVVVS